MKVYDVNWTKCIAFSSDNPSVMIGKNNSIFTRIAESSPDVYPVGCACHLAHFSGKKAASQLLLDVEQLVVDLHYHFDKSCKIKVIFKENLLQPDSITLAELVSYQRYARIASAAELPVFKNQST